MFENLKKQLIEDEGLKLKPYRCSANKLTIGIGRNIEDVGITEKEAMYLLEEDIYRCIAELQTIFNDFDNFSLELKEILINIIFNLGLTRFKMFVKFIQAIKTKNFELAKAELMNSKWFYQVGDRAKRLIQRLENVKN